MSEPLILGMYLNSGLLERARAGQHNFTERLKQALVPLGWTVNLFECTEDNCQASADRRGYSLFQMVDPFHARSLTMRRAYVGAFWQIEATARREEFDVASADFDPPSVKYDVASKFANGWRKRMFGEPHPEIEMKGFVLVPLQERLLQKRVFQTMSPLQMVQDLADRETRQIVLTLHPRGTYSDIEHAALSTLVERYPNVSLSRSDTDDLLKTCDYVATQNSSVAFKGYFLGKPALLFGQVDFHHAASCVWDIGLDRAIEHAGRGLRDFDQYLYWFLKLHTIGAGSDSAHIQIRETLARRGWPVVVQADAGT
jgi:hypothetical protein